VPVVFGEFVFDPAHRELRRGNAVVKIDPKQLDLLACFLASPGKLLSKQDLIDRVWDGRAIADSALSVAVAKLRKVLGSGPGALDYIENRYGRGYRFIGPMPTELPDLADGDSPLVPSLTMSSAPTSPLVGRADCLKHLEAALARASAGEGGLCILIGEPGIGKTRLAETLERLAHARGARTAWGRFQAAEGSPPLWPFAQVLRELNTSGQADSVLRVLSDSTAEREPQPHHAARESSLNQGFASAVSTSHRTLDEIAQALHRLSQRQPLAILLDDLQWADAASLRLLSYLVGDLPRWPVLIVATQRSSHMGPQSGNAELLRLLAHRNSERIQLDRLQETDVRDYVSTVFGRADAELSHAVFARSEGNPFFMVELLRPWAGVALPRADQLQLPGLSLDLVRQRLLGLPETARSALSAAAVVGHDFDLGLLSQVAERSAGELLDALDASLANDTVVPSAEVLGAYAFDHELIREVLYVDLAAGERCRLHVRTGQALERRRAAGVQVASAELAHHFLAALPQGDVAVAISHARNAALAATRLASHADARALLRRALEALKFWVEPNAETLTALLLELAMVERALGDAAYVDHLEQGVALARKHRFGSMLTIAGQLLSPTPGILARADAHGVLEAAAEVLLESDYKRRAIVLAHLAWTPPNCVSAVRVNALVSQADELAQCSGDLDAITTVRQAKLFFCAGPKTQRSAEAIADEIDRAHQAHPDASLQGRALSTLTFRLIIAMQRGDQAAVQHAIQQRTAALARLNNVELNWHHERMLLVQRMNRGEFAGVELEIEGLRERAERLGLQAWPILWARDYGGLLSWTGDVSAFAPRVRSSLAPATTDSPSTRSTKIRNLADFGFLDDARAALAEISIDSLYDLPCDRDYLAVISHLARASAAVRSMEHCRALYELLSPYPQYYAVGISFHCDGSTSHFLGLLARTLGNDEAALGHFESALGRNGEFGLKACTLQSRFELASLLLESRRVNDVARGTQLLIETRHQATQLGLRPLIEASERRLAGEQAR
jgi:DNA-binding winged helix-turn-helix (wHTH) protein